MLDRKNPCNARLRKRCGRAGATNKQDTWHQDAPLRSPDDLISAAVFDTMREVARGVTGAPPLGGVWRSLA